jgi:hypothetical protein
MLMTVSFRAIRVTGLLLVALLTAVTAPSDWIPAWAQVYEPTLEPTPPKEDIAPGPEFPVPIKPLPVTITPCRACHGKEKDFPVNFKRREALQVHRNIRLNHGGVRVWCLDCHHPDNRNYLLPLSDGQPITFDTSYQLCGKCHGTQFRDWRNGIHGKRTGHWNGDKTYLLCVSCHDPHSPKFKPLEPMPAPKQPWTPVPQKARATH